jgi:hypothetical protein
MDQDIDRGLIKVSFGFRFGIKSLAHSRVAEIIEKEQSKLQVSGKHTRRR